MPVLAQTNLQLLTQLAAAGWDRTALEGTAAAYELALALFSGQLRRSRKLFVEHLVGTASAVALDGARAALVLGALLHAAYAAGDFGDGRTGATRARRRELREVIGVEAEAIVRAFHSVRFDAAVLSAWATDPAAMDTRARDVALIRLANEADNRADNGLALGEAKKPALESQAAVASMVSLARALGAPLLAEVLAETSPDTNLVSGLASNRKPRFVPSRSHAAKPLLRLRALFRRLPIRVRRSRARHGRRVR